MNSINAAPLRFKRAAFTLVELSIVLVILGLLIGGVLTGQSLIRAAELRSVATQQARYVTATQTFRDKYFALPGDLTNAQSYWGVAHATAATCVYTASTDSKTCNGDGDGKIFTSTGSNERFRYWQHLANAGLIEGSYDGISHGTPDYGTTAANAPAGRISSSLWYAVTYGTLSAQVYAFDGQYDQALLFGGIVVNNGPIGPIFKPEEAYNLDMKMDDGKPGTGRVVINIGTTGWTAQTCTDATSYTQVTANYLLTNATLGCALIFRQVF